MRTSLWILLILSLILLPINSDQNLSEWQLAFQKMISGKYWYKLFLYTGKEQNDLGDYNQWINDLAYGTLRIINSGKLLTNLL